MTERIALIPCPFCGGPPVPFVSNYVGGGEAPLQDDYGIDGLMIEAYVFCHECGAQGPSCEKFIYERAEYLQVRDEAVRLWQLRDQRNIELFNGSAADGLNLYPRPDLEG